MLTNIVQQTFLLTNKLWVTLREVYRVSNYSIQISKMVWGYWSIKFSYTHLFFFLKATTNLKKLKLHINLKGVSYKIKKKIVKLKKKKTESKTFSFCQQQASSC